MMVDEPDAPKPYAEATGQFSVADYLKMIAVLSAVMAIAVSLQDWFYTPIIGGAVVGVFLAAHFAKSRFQEMICLLAPPLLVQICLGMGPYVSPQASLFNLHILWVIAVCTLVGIPFSAFAVVFVIAMAALFHRFTGIRLLKIDWD